MELLWCEHHSLFRQCYIAPAHDGNTKIVTTSNTSVLMCRYGDKMSGTTQMFTHNRQKWNGPHA